MCTLTLADLDRVQDLERDLNDVFPLSELLLLLRDDEIELLPLFTEELKFTYTYIFMTGFGTGYDDDIYM